MGDYCFNNTLEIDLCNDAIISSSQAPSSIYNNFGVNIQNITSGVFNVAPYTDPLFIENNKAFLLEMFHFANRLKVSVLATRGDDSYSPGISNLTQNIYPASLDENWITTVSGSGNDGNIGYHINTNNYNADFNSFYGNDVDISAPGFSGMIYSTANGTISSYDNFQVGTSNSSTHASGVAALLMSYLNDNTGASNYKNLAPEDIERILELSAKDVDAIGTDNKSGYGLLNAGKALQLVEKPHNTVYHFGTNLASNSTNTLTYTQVATGVNISTPELYTDPYVPANTFPAGNYKVNVYKVTDNITYNINSNEDVSAYWARHSSSEVLPLYDGTNVLTPRERITVVSCTSTAAEVYGYVYELLDATNNTIAWWPCNISDIASKAKFEITILWHDPNHPNDISSTNEEQGSINLYPNPANDFVTLNYNANANSKIEICLQDAIGNNIGSLKVNALIGNNNYHFDISKLSGGVYFYTIHDGIKSQSTKLIKK